MTLLKALSNKENLLKYKHLINPKTLSRQSLLLLKDYEVYFEQYTNLDTVDWTDFLTYFFQTRHPYLDQTQKLEYKMILERLAELESEDKVQTLLVSFEQQELYTDIRNDLDKNIDTKYLIHKLEDFQERKEQILKTDVEEEQEMVLEEALEGIDRSDGLQWRCKALQSHIGPIIRGDFIIVGGYTDSGKTSCLASELSYMAQQLKGDDYILWLNNEGDWKRILPRIYSAALNCTESELIKHKDKAKETYSKLMNGNPNRIKIMDIQGKHIKDIERMMKTNPPRLLVFDMLDHITGFEKYATNEGSHERYCKLYQWARELSSQYCPIIATSQLNREGSNCMYPEIVNMRGSGVDKQAAAVVVLMIGCLTGEDDVRYLSTPKFKLGHNKSWRAQVRFDSQRSRLI